MKLSDYLIDFLVLQKVTHIFEFIGGAIAHLLDSAHGRRDIACVSVHHEQSGAFAAEAYARVRGTVGVAMATSGPGALNMLTGIGSCYFDSVPCLFITGQVNTYEYKFDSPRRQVGFQETDIVSIATPITKYAHLVTDPRSIRYQLEKAAFIAQHGRRGPVLLDIPMNVQRAEIHPLALESFYGSDEHLALVGSTGWDPAVLDEIVPLIAGARRPVILAGGGVRSSGAADELLRLVQATGIPTVSSLMGIDALPADHPACFGMIGSYGNRYSNLAVANCDLLLILGSRLDTRQTGTRPETFARAARKIQVDIDPCELSGKVPVDLRVRADLPDFLSALNDRLAGTVPPDLSSWYEVIRGYRSRYPTRFPAEQGGGMDPNLLMEELSARCAPGDIVCLDVGQNQMWAAQSFRVQRGQRLLASGGMGAMGFALPAALGAVTGAPRGRAIVICGDGGLQVNLQELATVAQHRAPVKIFVLNNGCLGMVRQFQDMYFGGRQQSTVVGYDCPRLKPVAEAFGIPSFQAGSFEEAFAAMDRALQAEGPAFVEIVLGQGTNVNPKLVVNRPVEDMSPHLAREELAEAMLIDPLDVAGET